MLQMLIWLMRMPKLFEVVLANLMLRIGLLVCLLSVILKVSLKRLVNLVMKRIFVTMKLCSGMISILVLLLPFLSGMVFVIRNLV